MSKRWAPFTYVNFSNKQGDTRYKSNINSIYVVVRVTYSGVPGGLDGETMVIQASTSYL
ncbi:hypothetical protein DFQ01_101267 [Paenibacillus cellulosilyticus]|uniref:Uncharacterized protein n=1 Tax=Paenibacillus cellulosilyticus TaxID=375489 RepID=A0A2V2Z0E9_9BACL|nr:hypothetical protein DFQ01_101267 [Paenibacillus cellulosilyticus]